jgi:olefin beta-lactone synthetase
MPEAIAVVSSRRGRYETCTFRELEDDAAALARGLLDLGVRPGQRLVLLVKPGVEFIKLVFALLRTGATTVLIDPGMGRKHLVDCLAASQPDGFVAISAAQAARVAYRRRFPKARLNVTIGWRWFWGGVTYNRLLRAGRGSHASLPDTQADDAAAIIFTSGSTGPSKGVLYTHRMFDTQASEIQRAYDLQPGGVDLACFALFGLFNSVMGVTTVFPEMDFSRPASADPKKLLAAASRWQVTQAFASPAVWDKLSRHCHTSGERIPTLRKVFSCGAPVPASVLERTLQVVHPQAEMHTPYGATEALPIATIEAAEVLGETAARTAKGAGVCVGRKFDTIDWRIIRITDNPIATIEDSEELPAGEIGELIVRGPQVSLSYLPVPPAPSPSRGELGRGAKQVYATDHPSLTLPVKGRGPEENFANALAKIRDGDTIWHRMGDVGYLDDRGRFWYCGRKSQRVQTAVGTLYTEQVEAIFNSEPYISRAALVGIGLPGDQLPLIVLESEALDRKDRLSADPMFQEFKRLSHRAMPGQPITDWLNAYLPVDTRHNSKINREQVSERAAITVIDFDDHFDAQYVNRAKSQLAQPTVKLPCTRL